MDLKLESQLYNKLYEKQLLFFAKYYSVNNITINEYGVSYYAPNTNTITIGFRMLFDLRNKNKLVEKTFHSMFYTLLLHEIGHALYTKMGFIYDRDLANIHNILEDNRIERKLSEKNGRQNFKLLRYIVFDSMVENYVQNDAFNILFATRFANPEPMKKYLYIMFSKEIVEKIFELEKEFRYIDDDKSKRLSAIVVEIKELLSLANDQNLIKMNENQENSDEGENKENSGEGENKENSGEGENQKSSAESEKEKKERMKKEAKEKDAEKKKALEHLKSELEENDFDEEIEELEHGTKIFKSSKEYKDATRFNILTNDNPNYNKNDYEKYPIFLDSFKRIKGIRGKGNMPRNSGSITDLNMRRYMRSKVERDVKPFNIKSEDEIGRNTTKVIFYLDMSGSMQETYYPNYESLSEKVAAYVKNFYDKYHKDIEIEILGFGSNQYKLTRKELEKDFFFKASCGGTYPEDFPFNPKTEKVIFMTDGEVNTWGRFPNLLKHAIFVIIAHETCRDNKLRNGEQITSHDRDEREAQRLYQNYSIVPNQRKVLGKALSVKEAFNEATKKIANSLKI